MKYRCSTAARRHEKTALDLHPGNKCRVPQTYPGKTPFAANDYSINKNGNATWARLGVLALLLLCPLPLLADTQHFRAPLNAEKWEPLAGKEPSAGKESSAGKEPSAENLHCSLNHDIPLYGRAIFAKSAGHELGFRMTTKWNIGHTAKRARLRAMPPEWRPQAAGQDLGEVPVQPGNALFQLDESLTRRLLMALQNGMEVSFTYPAGLDGQDHIKVSLPGVNFRQAMDVFASCLSRLPVYDFADFSNTVMHFAAGNDGLNPKIRKRLDDIAKYLRTDPAVKKIIIEGHTDDIGQDRDNDKLSQRRSSGIRDYLQTMGVPAEKFDLRSLGERSPIYTNTTDEGRARNRRAYITLVREDGGQAGRRH